MTVIVLWPFLEVPCVGLLCLIVVFSDHTRLFFLVTRPMYLAKSSKTYSAGLSKVFAEDRSGSERYNNLISWKLLLMKLGKCVYTKT